MKVEEIITEMQRAFSDVPRPTMFLRGTCSCEECMEHEETMQALPQHDLPFDKLENPGWDPICFASDQAYAWLLPGLVRLVLEHTDDYVSQFMIHLDNTDRLALLTPVQARALLRVLDFLTLEHAEALDNNLVVDEVLRIRERLRT
jgi:hypothetical protein